MTARFWSQRPGSAVAAAAAISLIVAVTVYVLCGRHVALGFVGGVVTGAGMLSAFVRVLNKASVPAEERVGPTWPGTLPHVGEFAVVAAVG